MNRVLISNAYFYPLDVKQWKLKQPYPPLATLLATALLREKGYIVDFLDVNLQTGGNAITAVLKRTAPRYYVLYDDGFNYLSKMCLTAMRNEAFVMIAAAKAAGCTVIVSSSDASDHSLEYLKHGADFIIKGEAEQTLLELLHALDEGTPFSSIPGLCFLNQGSLVSTLPRNVMKDLDALPLPAWDLVDADAYRKIWMRHHGYFSVNIATTRGCPFKCNWCAKPIYGNRYTSRSPRHVIEEIKLIQTLLGPEHFWICDDIFALKPGWIDEFARLVKAEQLSFRYKIQSRVDLLLEPGTVMALAASGADTVWVGAESGSQKILDAMDKGTTVAQIFEATRQLRAHGIRVAFFLQFGYPGETAEDIQKTIDMLLRLMPDDIGISISYPLPGTKFYEKVRYQLGEKQNWTDSDDLAMMFESSFNSPFYKQLHRYVHSRYRRERGIRTLLQLLRTPLRTSVRDLRSVASGLYHSLQLVFLQRKIWGQQ